MYGQVDRNSFAQALPCWILGSSEAVHLRLCCCCCAGDALAAVTANFQEVNQSLIGWFSCRQGSATTLSMREHAVCSSMRDTLGQLPCLFFALVSPPADTQGNQLDLSITLYHFAGNVPSQTSIPTPISFKMINAGQDKSHATYRELMSTVLPDVTPIAPQSLQEHFQSDTHDHHANACHVAQQSLALQVGAIDSLYHALLHQIECTIEASCGCKSCH